MDIFLDRIKSNENSTIGKLSVDHLTFVTIEDAFHEIKIKGKTRIPAGIYEIKLKTYGGHHERYKKIFSFHKGMLWLQNVSDFKHILIHIGNSSKDSEGCILIGMEELNDDFILRSRTAYEIFYKHVIKAFDKKEKVIIHINDNKK